MLLCCLLIIRQLVVGVCLGVGLVVSCFVVLCLI